MSAVVILAAVASVAASAAVTPYPAAFFTTRQPNTALDMVSLLPGFTFDPGDQVRGFGGSAGNVLIDGARPASKDDRLDEILKRIPVGSVVRIDVIRGGAPGIDMQGKTMIANIIRRRDGGTRLVAAASTTVMQDGRIGWGTRLEGSRTVGPTSWEGSILVGRGADDSAGDGPRLRVAPGGVVLRNAAETTQGAGYNWKATSAVETDAAGGKLRLNGSIFVNPFDYTQADTQTLPPASGPALEHDHSNQRTAEVGLRYDHPLGRSARLEAFLLQQLGESRYTAAYDAPGDREFFRLAKETSESIGRVTVNLQFGPNLSLETGAEGDYNWLLDHTRYLVNGAPTDLPAANVRVTEQRGETFETVTWKPAGKVTLEGGLRLEASRIASTGDVVNGRSFLFAKPRAVVTWSPDAADQIRVRVEREVGQLDFDNFAAGAASLTNGAVHAGNPTLTPQQAWVVEAAYDRRFWGGGDATVTVRHYALTDVIDRAPIFDPAGAYDAPGNIGAGTKDEAAFALTLPTDRVGLKAGVLSLSTTFRRSRVIDPTTGLARPISGLHPQDAQLHFTQGLPKLKATWGFDIYDQWRETYYRFNEIDTDKLKTFVSVFGEYKSRPDLTIRLELENLGGRAVRHVREIYDGPRGAAPLAYTDIRDLHGGRSIYLRLRKSFG
jgi:hypothetical protein